MSTCCASRWPPSARSWARKTRGADDYRAKLDELGNRLPETVRTAVLRELERLERTSGQSPEQSWIRTWLDRVFDLPWAVRSDEQVDITEARRVLDADHSGLDDVKDRIVEFLAVRKLRNERAPSRRRRDRRHSGCRPRPSPAATTARSSCSPVLPASARPRSANRWPARWAATSCACPRRRPRRGRDPWSPAHLRRRPAGPHRAGHRRSEVDEPGHAARRGRQAVGRRMVGRPHRRAAGGARPGPEPHVPRPLPRGRARPQRCRVPGHRQHARDHPRPAARPHGSRAARRLHRGREGRHRPRPPAAPPDRAQRTAPGRDRRSPTRRCVPIISGYTREAGVRSLERELGTLLRKVAAKIADGHRRRRSSSTPPISPRYLRRPKVHHEVADRVRDTPVSRPVSPSPVPAATCCSSRSPTSPGEPGADPHRAARRRDEGVGADRPVVGASPRSTSSASIPSLLSARCTCTCRPARCPRTARRRASP